MGNLPLRVSFPGAGPGTLQRIFQYLSFVNSYISKGIGLVPRFERTAGGAVGKKLVESGHKASVFFRLLSLSNFAVSSSPRRGDSAGLPRLVSAGDALSLGAGNEEIEQASC